VSTLQPVDPNKRIEILDILRGFALLGIIFNNVLYFSGYAFMPFEQLRLFQTHAFDTKLYEFLDVVITAKFYTLFSILFALGFFLQFRKNQDNPDKFLKTYRRRLFILAVLGIIHSLIWFGDILLTYAILGFILLFFRNAKKKTLLRWAVVLIFLFVAGDLILLPLFQNSDAFTQSGESLAHIQYPDMPPEALMTQFKEGSIKHLFDLNLHHIVWKVMALLSSGRFITNLGLFILGYYLASIHFFEDKIKFTRLLIISGIVGFTAILAAKMIGGSTYHFPPTLSNILYKFLFTIAQVFMCLFYMTSLAKISQTALGRRILNVLKPVGRMALTNYLSQTLICILLFYNFGLDLAAELGFVYTILIVLGILIAQIICSNIWMKHFRFGPVEWLWRSLTYKKQVGIR